MNTWHLSWHGLRTVSELEVKQRIRSRRWIFALVGWFVLIGGLTALIIGFTSFNAHNSDGAAQNPGPIAFGLIVYLILGLGLVIAPAFTATSINGDRNAGVLALLQATRLSAVEIALGRLVAAWLTLTVFLLVALPFLAWAMALGQISVWQVVVCFVVVLLEVAIVAAVGLGWSALFNRTAASTVMTYLTVVVLTILLPGVMGMLTVMTQTEDRFRVWGLSEADTNAYQRQVDEYWSKNQSTSGATPPAPPLDRCQWNERVDRRVHPERVWWLLTVNPFVIVADAAPLPAEAKDNLGRYVATSGDPLASLRAVVRMAAMAPPTEIDECLHLYGYTDAYVIEYDDAGRVISVKTTNGTPVPITSPVRRVPVTANNPIWPWGLGASLILGAGMFWVAVRRLRIPYGVLTPGTRVA